MATKAPNDGGDNAGTLVFGVGWWGVGGVVLFLG